MDPPPSPKRVSAGLPRRVLDVSMREFSSLFAGYKNVTHDQCVLPLAANSFTHSTTLRVTKM